eukprot:TRINITY_DN3681_c1_g1_i1.p1 TRINITY_DN3681_c1_g1~~TRINITY_DN3681_c1_g1_i1.p1  ORF type:complete len:131 (-),score=27.44 TRINITY_DN3681_c1_g1_i1:255-647(-)
MDITKKSPRLAVSLNQSNDSNPTNVKSPKSSPPSSLSSSPSRENSINNSVDNVKTPKSPKIQVARKFSSGTPADRRKSVNLPNSVAKSDIPVIEPSPRGVFTVQSLEITALQSSLTLVYLNLNLSSIVTL